jgi:hypothetical protein
MGFNNPLTGENGSLIYQQIKSPNFSLSGQTGWAILKNGNAYFYNVVATGTITATEFIGTDFIIDSAGMFFYNGTPAAGNLLTAIAAVAGVDAFGNAYGAGVTVGAPGSSEQIRFGVFNGAPVQFFLSSIGTAFNNAAFMLNVSGAGTAAHDVLVLKSSQDNAFKDYVAINLNGNSNDGVTQQTSIQEAYVDTGGGAHFYRALSAAGDIIAAGSLTAVQPGTGTRATPAVGETWHAAALVNSFASNASDQVPRYRLEGTGGGIVRLDGTVYTTVGTAEPAGTTMFTLPVGYRPTIRKRFVGLTNAVGYAAGGTVIMANPNGTVTNGTAATSVLTQFCMDGITFPVD